MNKVTFVLESLCLRDNPRALYAYQLINEMAATGIEIHIITRYEAKTEFEFDRKNIRIFRPLKENSYLDILQTFPLLLSKASTERIHFFAPFSQKSWANMRRLKFFAFLAKLSQFRLTSLSGYDPSFHNWSQKNINKLNREFDLVFNHFSDELTDGKNQPLLFPISIPKDLQSTSTQKVIYILADFKRIIKQPHLLSILETFLNHHPEWKICVSEGWGSKSSIIKYFYEISWQKKEILHQWMFEKKIPLHQASGILDLSKTLSETLFYAQKASCFQIPFISMTPLLKKIKNNELLSTKNFWQVKNYNESLYEKLLLISNSNPQKKNFNFSKQSDFITNMFIRALSESS